jgi:hypothetical protein
MALGWLTLLKHVPWSDVIANAPAVADGAKKLWSAAARRPPAAQGPEPDTIGARVPESDRLEMLQEQIGRLEAAMLASSELINALAEQNAELVKRVESNRVQVVWLSIAVAAVGAFLAVLIAVLLSR